MNAAHVLLYFMDTLLNHKQLLLNDFFTLIFIYLSNLYVPGVHSTKHIIDVGIHIFIALLFRFVASIVVLFVLTLAE